MLRSSQRHCMFATRCADADEVYLCCDCLGWFSMRRTALGEWQLTLELPPGQHHVRYYARRGGSIIWHDQESVQIAPPAPAAWEDTSRRDPLPPDPFNTPRRQPCDSLPQSAG